ncbi:MAG: lysine decarboxylase DesA [Gemmatimonadaceae bacterium]
MTLPIVEALERDMAADAGHAFVALIAEYFARTARGDGPVGTLLSPAALDVRFEEPMPVHGRPLADVVGRLERDVLADVTRLYHPMYMGHQVSAPLPAAIWAESVVGVLNQSIAVWELSPTARSFETGLFRWMCALAGYGDRAGGTLTTGGTEATTTALLAARATVLPDAWEDGVGDDPPVVVCGEHAHYAVSRAVGELGLGVRRMVAVASRDGRMDVVDLVRSLDAQQRAGRRVMAVVATSGSTATGSFDDLAAIADVCDERGIWLHVDAAHGGSALFSDRHRGKLRGIARARTVAWDPHKMMLMPLSAGVLLARDERDLERAFSQRAPYLFHDGGTPRSPDQGTRSWLCSRRADSIKLWVALQRYGAASIGQLYDRLCDVAVGLHDELSRHSDFETLHRPEANILCFRYLGPGRSTPADKLDDVNRLLRERYNGSGRGWITTTRLAGRQVLRTTIMNPRTGAEHVAALVRGLAEVGETL